MKSFVWKEIPPQSKVAYNFLVSVLLPMFSLKETIESSAFFFFLFSGCHVVSSQTKGILKIRMSIKLCLFMVQFMRKQLG